MKTTLVRRGLGQAGAAAPSVDVSDDDLMDVIVLAGPRTRRFPLPDYPLLFSCSVNGIWPRHGNRRNLRVYVDRRSWLLDRVRLLALHRRPNPRWGDGGVVRISYDGAYLQATGELILRFLHR